jgi:hypothetical protein
MIENKRNRPDSTQLHKMVIDLLDDNPVMARCILGKNQNVLKKEEAFEKCREQTQPLIKWMGNLITLAGAFLYAKFNKWSTGCGAHPTDKERPNALYLKRLLAGVQSVDAYFDQASSGLRVLRVLDGLYDSFDMNFFVIKYIIINAQIEAGFNFQDDEDDERRGLSQLIGFPHEASFRAVCNSEKKFKKKGCNLAAAFNYISVYRNDPTLKNTFDSGEHNADIECAFEDVFSTMEFMKRVKLDIDTDGNVNFKETTATGTEEYIQSHGVVKVFETKSGKCTGIYKNGMNLPKDFIVDFYLLEGIEYLPENSTINAAIRFSYKSFDENDSVLGYFSEKAGLKPEGCDFCIPSKISAAECFKWISGYLPGTRSASSFFRGMITTHYRYHNILAPSIVDAIDDDIDAKNRILHGFVRNDKYAFKEALEPTFKTLEYALDEIFPNDWEGKIDKLCDYIREDDYKYRRVIDWDTLIARLLIYEGPSEIIKAAFLHETNKKQTGFIIHEINDKEKIKKVCDKIIAGLEMRYIDDIFDAETVSQKQKDKYNATFKKRVEQFRKDFPCEHANKIECKALVQSYVDTLVSTLTKTERNDIGPVNNKFAENSINDTMEILNERRPGIVEKAFLRTVRAFLSFYAGILECCSTRMSYEFEKGFTIMPPEKVKSFQDEIEAKFFDGVFKKARELYVMFDEEKTQQLRPVVKLAIKELWEFAYTPPDIIRQYNAVLARDPINAAKLRDIFYLDNNEIIIVRGRTDDRKDLDINFEEASDVELRVFLEKVVDFLAGEKRDEISVDKSNYTAYKEYARKVIYPQIVIFAKRREDCDANNCLIMDHSGAFADWHDGEVQILTEFKYDINYAYYAMPNLNRIETEWWVDPLLVSCHKFDEVIRNASNVAVGGVK